MSIRPRARKLILGYELSIERLDAKFKMGQDERLYDTGAAMEALEERISALADMMKKYNAHRDA